MIDLDQVRPLDAPELHAIRISLAVECDHIEPPFAGTMVVIETFECTSSRSPFTDTS
jgi:hypothetical protein